MKLSLKGTINLHGRALITEPPAFQETRRWSFQLTNPQWYVPDLDMQKNSSIELEYRPIIFGPTRFAHGKEPDSLEQSRLSLLAADCRCGKETAGFGNDCGVQQWITVQGGVLLKKPYLSSFSRGLAIFEEIQNACMCRPEMLS